jgi:hypothetical protein
VFPTVRGGSDNTWAPPSAHSVAISNAPGCTWCSETSRATGKREVQVSPSRVQLLTGRARVVAASDEMVLDVGDYAVIPLAWESFEALEDAVVLLSAAVQGRKD